MISITKPTVARLDSSYEETSKNRHLKISLRYVDKKVEFSIKRFKNTAHWYSNNQEEYNLKLDELKSQRVKTVLFEDENGLWTYSGLAHKLGNDFNDEVKVEYTLPSEGAVPYMNTPKHEPRYYQIEAKDALLANANKGPCRVSIGTGLGKSTIIRMLVYALALKTVIMAPSVSIANQLFDDFASYFGKRYVGKYGDGKKQSDKLFVVAIDDSLTRVEPGSEHWENLSKAQVFIADESHLVPSETLAKVCLGLCESAPYRFFFSATQIRNDGLDLVLDGLTGPTVYSMPVRQGIDEGYLSRPYFKMVNITSDINYNSTDPGRMTRKHFYYNQKVIKAAADLANRFVDKMKRPTIILVEELEQFTALLPHLKHDVRFAHGPLDAKRKKLIPVEYHSDDPTDLVSKFNAGEIPILVGTSCIATGTDLQAVEALIYLQGKSSEIKTKQAVGRATRGGEKSFVFNPWTNIQKKECIYVDFNVTNVDILSRHARMRKSYYDELYGPTEEL